MNSETFISLPVVQEVNGEKVYCYDGIKIEFISETKGHGVIASKPLKKGFSFPYGGRILTSLEEVIKLRKRSGRPSAPADYIIINRWNSKNEPVAWLDGNPLVYNKLYPTEPSGAWIGAFVNEPSEGIKPNGTFIARSHAFKRYPNMHDCNVYIKLIENVNIGEEIVVNYGYSSRIRTLRGYSVVKKKGKNSKCSMDYLQLRSENMKAINARRASGVIFKKSN